MINSTNMKKQKNMKTLIKVVIIPLLYLFPFSLSAQQLDEITCENMYVSYDRTFHLIYPTDIKYFSIGNENVVAEKVLQCPTVLKIKAAVNNYKGATNLSVVTADGKFYSYLMTYNDSLFTSYKQIDKLYAKPHNLPVSASKEMHLIFPMKIIYVDYGDTQIRVEKAEGVDNILALRAVSPFEKETNISIITEDGKFYTFDLFFSIDPKVISFVVNKQESEKARVALLDAKELNSLQKEVLRKKINKCPPMITNIKKCYAGMVFSISNIFIDKDILFFKFRLSNISNIDYSVDFVRFYIQDAKKRKKTAVQQIEQEPLFIFDLPNRVEAHETKSFTVALNKFTIPDKKILIVEIQEAGGGRHFYYKLKNKPIINAEMLYPNKGLEKLINN